MEILIQSNSQPTNQFPREEVHNEVNFTKSSSKTAAANNDSDQQGAM